jgi:hypothetical protein
MIFRGKKTELPYLSSPVFCFSCSFFLLFGSSSGLCSCFSPSQSVFFFFFFSLVLGSVSLETSPLATVERGDREVTRAPAGEVAITLRFRRLSGPLMWVGTVALRPTA